MNLKCVSGLTFLDENNDKIKQTNEPLIPNCRIFDDQNLYAAESDEDGHYIIYLPLQSTVNLHASNDKHGVSESFNTNSQDTFITHHFGLNYKDETDLAVYLSSHTANKAKQGFVSPYQIDVYNYSDVDETIEIKLEHPEKLKNLVFSNFSTQVQTNTSFTINSSIPAHSSKQYYFNAVFDVDSFELGEKVQLRVGIQHYDWKSSNNTDTLNQKVVAAFDPNIKVANPERIVNIQKEIAYTIWFQNEGNDTALNVTVVDTFGTLFNLSKIVVGGTSHGNIRPQVENNSLIWSFRNIKLPPKSTDSINSIGFVSFRSQLTSSAKIGDTVYNKAAIFFDYQKPIITNKAGVLISKNVSLQPIGLETGIQFYPNPSKGQVFYKNTNAVQGVMGIYDLNGKQIHQQDIHESGEIELPEKLSAGIYALRILDKGLFIGKLILLK
ncbi:MAG: T9SS type A sorting domain-containing protein [Bacteroidia bacterium]